MLKWRLSLGLGFVCWGLDVFMEVDCAGLGIR